MKIIIIISPTKLDDRQTVKVKMKVKVKVKMYERQKKERVSEKVKKVHEQKLANLQCFCEKSDDVCLPVCVFYYASTNVTKP